MGRSVLKPLGALATVLLAVPVAASSPSAEPGTTSSRSRGVLLAGLFALCLLLTPGVLISIPTASAASEHVYKVPNLLKPGLKPSISVRVALPKGVKFVPEYVINSRLGEDAGDWFQGGGFSAAVGKDYGKIGTATPDGDVSAPGFGWQRTRPPKCIPTWRVRTVGNVHICQAYCISLVITCYYHTWSAFSPISDQVEHLWKPAARGGYLYLGLDLHVKLRNVDSPNFSNRVFTEALAIIRASDRVG